MHQTKMLIVISLALVLVTSCIGQAKRWEEPFDETGKWDLHSDASAQVKVVDGLLRIEIKTANQLAWASAERTYGDFLLTVEATQLAGPDDNAYGILARMDGDNHFYAFSISGDGYVRAARYDDGTWNLLGGDWQAIPAIHQGQALNVLMLEARGSTFIFSVNAVPVIEVMDTTLKRGDVGLYAGSFAQPGVVIAFDNLEIETLP